ncbi:MAG: M81 family metallopeptidase [Chloroflexi bacterium]|nr:M81 family metallopeptidase [Chloroflexota bacterium]
MRLAVIGMAQETDTFNPQLTTLDDFRAYGLYEGQQMLEDRHLDARTRGFLTAVRVDAGDIEVVPIIRGIGGSYGRIARAVLDHFLDRIGSSLRAGAPLDGLALQLHGGCCADGIDDVEGAILETCREALGPDVPIVLSLDHHANLTRRMVMGADLIVGFRTQPHDPYETSIAAAQLLFRLVRREIAPRGAWRKLPLISHQEQYLTSAGPMRTWFQRARAMERIPGVLTVSNFPVQPWLDIEEMGFASCVYTDGDQALADRLADELADLAWSLRDELQVQTSIPVVEALQVTAAAPHGVVILSDHGDSVFGGSACDSTTLLEAILGSGMDRRVLIPLVDGESARACAALGPGASITRAVGGTLSGFFRPVTITGTVRTVADGQLYVDGLPDPEMDMGVTVIVDCGPVTLMISEQRGVGGNHPGVYRAFGVEPADFHAVVLKTASNFQWFRPIAAQVIRVDTPGPTQSDIGSLPWARIPRPMYPLDPVADWRQER